MGDAVELKSFLEPLKVKVGGVVYEIPSPAYPVMLEMVAFNAALAAGETPEASDSVQDLHEKLFGHELHERLKADRVPYDVVRLMASAVYTECVADRDQAEVVLQTGAFSGEARARSKTGSRGKGKKQTTRTGGESTTNSPDSGTGTSTTPSQQEPVMASAGRV